ncbi:hypothetical protein Jolie2_50 [Mycobacterium phage Jolie2]|uniref:Uncharacterized protein n=1 Tax=Mycobacterium phage Jolie2 TaxID=1458831 RepID=W8EI11_9CAUD|nr:hypothetical protein Jolie2_50 [Mycobacterium phage Jolie2]AHJ86600.1 hypothetical protein Jolie2_50 [Mycobacterium phage Jolie2]
MAGSTNENVAIFNPLILPLPAWHPDGPDGTIDGFVVPFVLPAGHDGKSTWQNRQAKMHVRPTDHGWRASLLNCQDHAETAAQARAHAAAWIRAAELLEAQERRIAAEARAAAEDDVVDAEVVDDDEDQDDEPEKTIVIGSDQLVRVTAGEHAGREGRIESSTICAGEPITYHVLLKPDDERKRGFETVPITDGALEVVDNPGPTCPACLHGTCTLHAGHGDEWANAPDNPDGSCAGCGVYVDNEHDANCPVYLARLRRGPR